MTPVKRSVKKKVSRRAKKIVIPRHIFRQVNEGVKFLDIVVGRKEWLSRMNMSMFNIDIDSQCVCGNVFSNGMNGYDAFIKAMNLLHVKDSDGVKFGFYADKGEDNDWPFLQDVWVATIKKLRKQAKIK